MDEEILSMIEGTTLEEDDLFDLKQALHPVAVKWKDIGIAFGLRRSSLEIISHSFHDPVSSLSEMLEEWLKQNYNVRRFGEPTWRKVAKVVAEESAGANIALAKKLARKHFHEVLSSSVCESPPATNQRKVSARVQGAKESALIKKEWYHRVISEKTAEQRLRAVSNDCFLVRNSEGQCGSYVLSLKYKEKFRHFRVQNIATSSSKFEQWITGETFRSLDMLVEYYKQCPLSTSGEVLKTPCPRNIPLRTTATTYRSQSDLRRKNSLKLKKINHQVQQLVDKCTCPNKRFKVTRMAVNKYRFGDSEKLYEVLILRSTVKVKVGGTWIPLEEFVQKKDPCRVPKLVNRKTESVDGDSAKPNAGRRKAPPKRASIYLRARNGPNPSRIPIPIVKKELFHHRRGIMNR